MTRITVKVDGGSYTDDVEPRLLLVHYLRDVVGKTAHDLLLDVQASWLRVQSQVALWQAVQANDLPRARAVNDRIYPVAQAFYATPFLDMHNRMKEALVLLGRVDRAVVRPPLMKLSDAEIARVRKALSEAGIAPEGALNLAA